MNSQLNELARTLNPNDPLPAVVIRRKLEHMHKKCNRARDRLSETGQNQTASEIVGSSRLEKKRAQAVKDCHYFETWMEIVLDRRTSAPARVRVAGHGVVSVDKEGRAIASTPKSEAASAQIPEQGQSSSSSSTNAVDNSSSAPPDCRPSASSQPERKKSRPAYSGSSVMETMADGLRQQMVERTDKQRQRDQERARREERQLDQRDEELAIRRVEAETQRIAQENQRKLQDTMIAIINKQTQM
ncbi:hypothetical protein CF319_g3120 [Tilletia indica]|nr:hypothetical protein CF319_g3120 [Tilletia indica]